MIRNLTVTAILILVVVLGACSSTTQDRETGSEPDFVSDATQVTLYRNVDDVPNVAVFCAGRDRFAATLSGDGVRSPSLVWMGPCSGESFEDGSGE